METLLGPLGRHPLTTHDELLNLPCWSVLR